MPWHSVRPKRLSVFLAVFALLLAALPALLASNADAASSTKTKTWKVKVGAESSSGAVQTMGYGPKKIWINAGDTVHWTANSMEPHTVSFINDKHPAVAFDTTTTYMTAQTSKDTISEPGQFRTANDLPRTLGAPASRFDLIGHSAIADSPDEVRLRVREQLLRGASQIKLTAGGGVASPHSPLDVSTFTEAELRAAVDAADNWGTYVAVHAYTPAAIMRVR